MDEFVDMFKDLTFYRVKDTEGYLVYAAKVYCLTGDGERYVMIVVPNVPSLRMKTAKIQHLRWISIQTRIFTTSSYNIPAQDLDYKILDSRYGEKITLSVVSRTASMTNYHCNRSFGNKRIDVSILHDPKKKSVNQYPDSLDLRHALKTFRCIIKFEDS